MDREVVYNLSMILGGDTKNLPFFLVKGMIKEIRLGVKYPWQKRKLY